MASVLASIDNSNSSLDTRWLAALLTENTTCWYFFSLYRRVFALQDEAIIIAQFSLIDNKSYRKIAHLVEQMKILMVDFSN